MKKKSALITGITGQDGSYLAELLYQKGYQVHGLISQKHSIGDRNIRSQASKYNLIPGDLTDKSSLKKAFDIAQPDEVYNLAAITFVPDAWRNTSTMVDINTIGPARLLEIIISTYPHAKFYQASSAKIFGHPNQPLVSETTLVAPTEPYGISKAAAHNLINIYRQQSKLFAVSGILFNHESERRGQQFVTRKITLAAAKIKLGLATEVFLGDLNAQADWGYAPEYVQAIYLMMQAKKPADYVVATGKLHKVADVCQTAFSRLGLDYRKYVKTDPNLLRSNPARPFAGDYSKIKAELGWQPHVGFQSMIQRMVDSDLKLLKQNHKNHG